MSQKTTSQELPIEATQKAAEDTQASMTEKYEVLGDRVRDTLEGTRSAANDIVDNVKGTVEDTVEAVKDTIEQAKSTVDKVVGNVKETASSAATTIQQSFDLPSQVARHPWTMFGGAVFVGYVVGNWTMPNPIRRYPNRDQSYPYDNDDNLYAAAMNSGTTVEDLESTKDGRENGSISSSYMSETAQPLSQSTPPRFKQSEQLQQSAPGKFSEEWNILKSVAFGSVLGTLRTMARQQLPTLAPHLDTVFNRLSTQLGAEPVEPTGTQEQSQEQKQPHASAYQTSSSFQASADPSPASGQPYPNTQYRR